MSRHSAYRHSSRFDSALDLSHSDHHTSENDVEVPQSVAASSVMAPWSPYNTRGVRCHDLFIDMQLIQAQLNPGHVRLQAPSEWTPDLYTSSNLSPIDRTMQAFECSFATTDPILRCTSPDTLISCNNSPPATSSLLLPFGTSPSASITPPPNPGEHPDYSKMCCENCGQEFPNTFEFGNLAPQPRHKQLGADNLFCNCTTKGYLGIFHRQDPKMKYGPHRDPALHLPPIQTQYDHLTGSYVHKDLNYNVDQWLHTYQSLVSSPTAREQEGFNSRARSGLWSCDPQYVLTTLAEKLKRTDFTRVCNAFFTRWESIVQELSNNNSDAHCVYSKVIEDLYIVLYAINGTGLGPCRGSDGQDNRSPPSKRAEPRGNNTLVLGRGTASRMNRITKRSERKMSPANGPGKLALAALGESGNDEGRREVDCPVYKHHIMHNTAPPCRGCRVSVMSQVRSHLNPNRAAGTHRGFPQFIEQCSRCKRDFVDRQLYDDHRTKDCVFQRQTRGDIVVSWARQYLALYPDTQRIPLPWPNAIGWLPDSVLSQCRAPCTDSNSPSAFLEERQEQNNHQPQSMNATVDSSDEPGYAGAMNHVLHDLTNPTFLRSTRSSTPMPNPDRHLTNTFQVPSTAAIDGNRQHWQRILSSFETHQRTIREAAAHLSGAQLGFMARESERMLAISRGLYRQHHEESPRDNMNSATSNASLSPQGNDAVHSISTQLQRLETSGFHQLIAPSIDGSNEIMTPSTDTLPSARSYGASSSQHPTLTLTNPSSQYSPVDLTVLSHYSSSGRHQTSPPLDIDQDASRSRRAFFSQTSLPEDADVCSNPSLINSPNDSNGGYFSESPYPYLGSGC
jgi:hypothetical protein